MKLKTVHIREFRSINDSEPFDIGEVTCLVGKNESGKTALLRALYQMNPFVAADAGYSITGDYPRVNVEDYRHEVQKAIRQPATVARVKFELDEDDAEAIQVYTGEKDLKGKTIEVTRGFEGDYQVEYSFDEVAALKNLVGQHELPENTAIAAAQGNTVAEVLDALTTGNQTEAVTSLTNMLAPASEHVSYQGYIVEMVVKPRIPKFLYFDEYYQMQGCENIEALMRRKANNQLQPSDHPLLGLINRARLNLDQLVAATSTRDLKNKLQGASNHLTKQVIRYWSQNKHLRLFFDVREARANDPDGMQTGTNIWSEVEDTKHFVTTEIGTRSHGFIWFFSFLAWYSDVRDKGENVILLLDEPGLSLHGKAQEDLLKYFEVEIMGQHQLIYTTHSPFMVDPTKFDRVRIVQDLSVEHGPDPPPERTGTRVLTDVLEATEDSLFPLQGALGYEISQTLFVGPNSLVVEGVSDLLFLQGMSSLLEADGRVGLSKKWTITPVGGADKVPTFVALLGAKSDLNLAVLVDYQKKDRQTIENLYKKKLLAKKQVLTYVDFTKTREADVEDMFDEEFYLGLVNGAFKDALAKPVTIGDLNRNLPRITKKLKEYFDTNPLKNNESFNHFRPAKHFLDTVGTGGLSKDALTRFEEAFKALNKLVR
ncbi:MAG: AAA family ATPase [Rhodothermaceae bacterium]|nr:AAA family ATPase [Bacteroidota bacterium]MXW33499.1 AAA family ATPase [Rhodothermaceae bacterium]MYE63066.1 AAA family ATPase [Rhodothermaceae bacterium]MYJ20958.1 AAA family ATPase [Rhodothermaceae bacterium]